MWIAEHLHSIQARVRLIEADTRIDEQITILETPGHPPGCISCFVNEEDIRVALVGDAIKNAYDYVAGVVKMSFDKEASRKTIEKIQGVADIIVPGHDRPFCFKRDQIIYLSDAEHEIKAGANPYSDAWITFKIGFADSDTSGDIEP